MERKDLMEGWRNKRSFDRPRREIEKILGQVGGRGDRTVCDKKIEKKKEFFPTSWVLCW